MVRHIILDTQMITKCCYVFTTFQMCIPSSGDDYQELNMSTLKGRHAYE